MFTIYADGQLVYAPHLIDEGCGVFSPTVTVELNKSGSLEFTMPPNNAMYNNLHKLKTIVTAYNGDDEIFRGRVLHDEKDFYMQKKVYCEGELSFLLDTTVRPLKPYGVVRNWSAETLLRNLIGGHNDKIGDDLKKFNVGNVTAKNKDEMISYTNTGYPTVIDEIMEKIIGVHGGYLKLRHEGQGRYIDWVEEPGVESTQAIEFGSNLLDLTEHITAEDIFTVIIPLGASQQDEEGNDLGKLTIDDDNPLLDENLPSGIDRENECLIHRKAVQLFGRVEATQEWSEVTKRGTLITLGCELLNNNASMATTLSVRAVDLHMLNVDTEQIHVGDKVRVISNPHGVDTLFDCTRISYDLISPDQTEYTFGASFKALTEQQLNDKKAMKSTTEAVQNAVSSAKSIAGQASTVVKEAENIINNMTGSYVSKTEFQNHLTDISTFKTEVSEDVERLEQSVNSSVAEVGQLKQQVNASLTTVNQLSTSVSNSVTTVNNLRDQVNEALGGLDGDYVSLDDYEADLKYINDDLTDHSNRIALLEAASPGGGDSGIISDMQDDISNLNDRMMDAELSIDNQNGVISDLNTDVSGLKQFKSNTETSLSNLNNGMIDLELSLDSQNGRISDLNADVSGLKQFKMDTETDIDDIKEQVNDLLFWTTLPDGDEVSY